MSDKERHSHLTQRKKWYAYQLTIASKVFPTTGCVLLRLLVLWASCHLTLSLGYSSPCDGPVPPNDLGLGHGPGPGHAGRRQTVAFLLTGGIPSSQPGLLGFHRTVRGGTSLAVG